MSEREETNGHKGISRRRFLRGTAVGAAGAAVHLLTGGRAWSPVAGSESVAAQSGGDPLYVNVRDARYGAAGDGKHNDRAAFQAAIDAAIGARLPLLIPATPAFYRLDLDGGARALDVHGDLIILGGGRELTTLRFAAPQAAAGEIYAGFLVRNGVNFELRNLRLEEPDKPSSFELHGVTFESGVNDHQGLIERVDIAGFSHCVHAPSGGTGNTGELALTLRDCDLHPGYRYALALWSVADGHKRLHMAGCHVHDNQDSHLVYCHPHNSVHVENCRFDGATGWAWHFQGSAVASQPEYQRFVNCWFGPRNSRGLITHTNGRVQVSNCVFECRPAIQIRSDIQVEGCYFTTPRGVEGLGTFVSAYGEPPWRAAIRDCIFAPLAPSSPQVDLRLDDIDVLVENCQFFNSVVSISMLATGGRNSNTLVSNCLFQNKRESAAHSAAIWVQDGLTTVQGCRFEGRFADPRGAIHCAAAETFPGPAARLELHNNLFSAAPDGKIVHLNAAGANTWSNKVFGSHNGMALQAPYRVLTISPEGARAAARLTPTPGSAPDALAAETVLVVNSNYDAYRISGAGTINTIQWWEADGRSNPLFTGRITLIAADGFTLAEQGNVSLALGGAGRFVGREQSITLTYDPARDRWYPAQENG
jgi:hypothetical protein